MPFPEVMSPVVEFVEIYLDKFVQWNVDHEWIGSQSLVFVTPGQGLDAKALELADLIGLDAGTMKYVLLLLVAYPLAAIFAKLPNATTKHIFSLFFGVWIMQFVFYAQWIHSFMSSAISYLMVLVLPNKYMPQIVFAFVLGYICLSHIYRVYVDYMGWSLDFTGPQMVLTIKLSSFAYNVWDGRKWAEIEKDTGDKKKDRILAARREYALRAVPNPLEFFGYIYCFSSILAGPAFEYKEYINAVTGKAFEKENGLPGVMPTNWKPAMGKLASGLTCLALFQVGGSHFPLSAMRAKEAMQLTMPVRIVRAWITLFFVRMKYFFAWKTSDGASVLGGFGFEGFDKYGNVVGWDGVSNIDIMAFETSGNVTTNTRAWNKRTQGWLERYVYMRTGNSLMATYFVSAFWHGFYPGYYLFFMSLPMVTAVARIGRKKFSPYFTEGLLGLLYNGLCVVAISFTVNYLVIPFQMLGFPESIDVWGTFYFGVHVAAVVLYLVGQIVPTKKAGDKTKSA